MIGSSGWGPPPRVTRTSTRYFDEVSLRELQDAYTHLAGAWESRRPFVPKRVAMAVEHRLELVRHAWALLLEPVPEDFYG